MVAEYGWLDKCKLATPRIYLPKLDLIIKILDTIRDEQQQQDKILEIFKSFKLKCKTNHMLELYH